MSTTPNHQPDKFSAKVAMITLLEVPYIDLRDIDINKINENTLIWYCTLNGDELCAKDLCINA